MAKLVAAEWNRKSSVVADTALQGSGLDDPEEFCRKLTDDPEVIAPAQKVLFAASVTGSHRKLRALGTLLGEVAGRRRDKLDETNLLIGTLSELEGPHVVVMHVITGPPPDDRPGWLAAQVQAVVEMEPDLVLVILNALTRHGIAKTDNDTYGAAPQFMLTKFGNTFMQLMKGETTDATQKPPHPRGGYSAGPV